MKSIIFPGQGSQAKGMGELLFDDYAELTEKADNILGYSVKELCLEDPRQELNKTQFTQPALYVVNALSYFKKVEEFGEKPDFLAGHSLGEFNALLAAECFEFEAGLKLVKKRGELMAQAKDGAMAAILNSSKGDIERILRENNLNNVDLANYNTLSQIVISGSIDEIAEAQSLFQFDDVLYYPLNTSGAFHSRFMQPSQEKFKAYLKRFKLSEITIPVISNVTGRPYTGDDLLKNLSSQISSTVRWCDSVQYLLAQDAEMEFSEVGHGDVLTKLVDTIRTQSSDIPTKIPASSSTSSVEKVIEPVEASKEEEGQTNTQIEATDQQFQGPDIHSIIKDKVKKWNLKYTIGTKVESTTLDYGELETSTEAVVLFSHRAAVYMKGYNGYFDLDEIRVI